MNKFFKLLLIIIIILLIAVFLTEFIKKENIKNTKELEYNFSSTIVKLRVPDNANPEYRFTTEKPENSIAFSGTFYLVGEKVNISFSSDRLFGEGVDTFTKFTNYLKSDIYDGTYKILEETKMGNRKALKIKYTYGTTSSDSLYGYTYLVDADNTDKGLFYKITVVKNDFSSGNIDEIIKSKDVSKILNSIRFEK